MASHPAFCRAVICSAAVSVQSRAVMNSPLDAEMTAACAGSFSTKSRFIPRALHDGVPAIGHAVAAPACGAVEHGGALVVQQVRRQRRAAAHVGVADQAGRAVGKSRSAPWRAGRTPPPRTPTAYPCRRSGWRSVPCRLSPASSRMESGVEAFSAAASASVVRSPCSPAVAKTGTVMSPTRTRQVTLGAVGQRGRDRAFPLSVRARTVPFLSTVAIFVARRP